MHPPRLLGLPSCSSELKAPCWCTPALLTVGRHPLSPLRRVDLLRQPLRRLRSSW
jgi:hypothetical protein